MANLWAFRENHDSQFSSFIILLEISQKLYAICSLTKFADSIYLWRGCIIEGNIIATGGSTASGIWSILQIYIGYNISRFII